MSTNPIDIRRTQIRRRLSAPSFRHQPARLTRICHPLPHSLEALDLSTPSPTQCLASLRFLILSYLADIEERLAQLTADSGARTALDMLKSIREDVCSHLPEFHFADMEVVESFIKSHMPDFDFDMGSFEKHLPSLRLPDMPDVRSRLPDINIDSVVSRLPNFPSMNDVKSRLSDFELDVKSRLSDLDFELPGFYDLDFAQPFSYIPTLSAHLQTLHSHLATLPKQIWCFPGLPVVFDDEKDSTSTCHLLPSLGLTPGTFLSDLLDALLSSSCSDDVLLQTPAISDCGGREDYMQHSANTASSYSLPTVVDKVEKMLVDAAVDAKSAIQHSLEGGKLIAYAQLPAEWRNNPFVIDGYRFIPLERWHLIVASLFQFHNETLNIHTHLIPFTLWSLSLLPVVSLPSLPLFHFLHPFTPSAVSSFIRNTNISWPFAPPPVVDTPETLFMLFALLCLFTSSIWHTMAGCAHRGSMEFCARVDYVGIGWLISASVATVVHYGYRCHPNISSAFLALSFCTGLAGNVLPFMQWFNMYEYRYWRIAFFLSLAFSALAPLAGLAMLYSVADTLSFMSPVVPSLVSYLVGLGFYATHVPERWLSDIWRRRMDRFGGGSHSIWHCFIVLAVSQHRAAIKLMREGIRSANECVVT